ncbi:patatin-like phospholipase family protein [Bacteroidales bacterium OttesenSCG-928-K22]|nr:patatin-like phospholipase family protein [Bacteroidales bacterium OttesenSCG-928-K22]
MSTINLHAQEKERPTVGVVLSGGGAKGFAHIGVLQVLTDKGIPIDYICGTSMGSLVGGLYASGYSPDSIKHIMENADWKFLMNDKVPRDYIAYDSRADHDKYILGLTFARGMKPELPGGLVKGQNLMMQLNEYFAPVLDINDFSKLKIPYFCVGADIIHGKDVILESGYLPEAIRASIAVPTVFSPIKIGDMLLIDGGFYNNFPTKELKDKGVDIIIGINVGFEAYSTEKLQSVVEVASQLLWINNVKRNIESKEYCDILIEPDLESYSSSAFTNVDQIIDIGRETALASSNQIDSLAAYLASFNQSARINPDFESSLTSPEKLISSTRVVGIENTSLRYLTQNMMLSTDKPMTITKINDGIKRTMGTLNYEEVYYKLLPDDSTYMLAVKVEEKKPILMQLGAGYDSDFKASLRLRVAVRNLFFKSTKFTAKARISRYPNISLQYVYIPPSSLFSRAFESYSAIGLKINLSTYQLFGYNKDRSRISESQLTVNDYTLFYQYYFREHFLVEFGIQNRFAWNHEIVIGEIPRAREMIVGAYANITKDRLNDVSYPTKGDYFDCRVFFDFPYHTTLIPINVGIFANYSVVVPIGKKVFFSPEIYVGLNHADTITKSRQMFIGGMNSYEFLNNIKFAGYGSSELRVNQAVAINANLRWHIMNNHHLLFKSSFGVFSSKLTEPELYQYKAGVGIGYSFDSYIGPLEIVVSNSILEKGWPKVWVCLGYQF